MKNRTDWKTWAKPFAAVSLIALAAAGTVPAQAGPGGQPGACRTLQGDHERHGPMGFGRFGGDESGPMLRGLDLSETQRDRVFELRHAQEPRQREQMKQVRASREALHALARGDNFDPAQARMLADSHAKAVSEMAMNRVEFESKLRALLTPEQRETFDERQARRQQPMGPRGGQRRS